LASLVLSIYLAVGNIAAATWILVFNIVLNGYPVMLQRSQRWRIQQVRAQIQSARVRCDQLAENPESIKAPPNSSLERRRER
jgi:hypothetical protein